MPAAISPTTIAATTMQNGGHHCVFATKWLRWCQRSLSPCPTRPATSSHSEPVTAAAATTTKVKAALFSTAIIFRPSVGDGEADVDGGDYDEPERVQHEPGAAKRQPGQPRSDLPAAFDAQRLRVRRLRAQGFERLATVDDHPLEPVLIVDEGNAVVPGHPDRRRGDLGRRARHRLCDVRPTFQRSAEYALDVASLQPVRMLIQGDAVDCLVQPLRGEDIARRGADLDVGEEQTYDWLRDPLRQPPVMVEDERFPILRRRLTPPISRRRGVGVGVVRLEPRIRTCEGVVNLDGSREPNEPTAQAVEGLDENERAGATHARKHHGEQVQTAGEPLAPFTQVNEKMRSRILGRELLEHRGGGAVGGRGCRAAQVAKYGCLLRRHLRDCRAKVDLHSS